MPEQMVLIVDEEQEQIVRDALGKDFQTADYACVPRSALRDYYMPLVPIFDGSEITHMAVRLNEPRTFHSEPTKDEAREFYREVGALLFAASEWIRVGDEQVEVEENAKDDDSPESIYWRMLSRGKIW